MPTSPETFAKVKDILRAMEQSIESARSRRLAGGSAGGCGTSAAREAIPPATPARANGAAHPPAPNGSVPLRAKPLMRPQNDPRAAFS